MSRKRRVWYPGATYHVMSRGNRRTVLFKEKSDYMCFLECIAYAKRPKFIQLNNREKYCQITEYMI